MLACINENSFKRKSPTKVTFSFKWKNITSSHLRNIYLLEKLGFDHLRSNHLRNIRS